MAAPKGKLDRPVRIQAHPDFQKFLKSNNMGGDLIDTSKKTKLIVDQLIKMGFRININITDIKKNKERIL
jgi:hypothetical protein